MLVADSVRISWTAVLLTCISFGGSMQLYAHIFLSVVGIGSFWFSVVHVWLVVELVN